MKLMPGSGLFPGVCLIAGFVLMLGGAMLFISRPADLVMQPASPRLIVERALIMAAAAVNALGLLVLATRLQAGAGGTWARAGAYLFLLAVAVLLNAEALSLARAPAIYPLIVVYVLGALVAQALFGYGIVRSELLPGGVGWAMIVWNLAFLVILPLTTPRDVHFPVVHHLMPLAIGVALLVSKPA